MSTVYEIHALERLREYLDTFAPTLRRSAQRYVDNSQVVDLRCLTPKKSFQASVGRELAQARVYFTDDIWIGLCDCPKGIGCKHVAALAGQLLRQAGNVDAAELGFEEEVVRVLGRALSREENQYMKSLSRVYEKGLASGGRVSAWDLQPLGFPWVWASWEQPKLWPEYPKSLKHFWLYLAHALRQHQAHIPAFLKPLSDPAPIAESLQRWRRREEIERWRHSLNHSSIDVDESDGAVMDFRLILGDEDVSVEQRVLPQETFRPIKTTELRRLFDLHDAEGISVVPEAELLWECLCGQSVHFRNNRLRYDDSAVLRVLGAVIRSPTLSSRVLSPVLEPLKRMPEALRWQVKEPDSPDGDYAIQLVDAAGAPVRNVRVALPGHPTLYVVDDCVYTGPRMVRELGLDSVTKVPAPAMETAGGLRLMGRIGAVLPSRLENRVQRIKLGIQIVCDIKPKYPGSPTEQLVVQVIAQSAQGERRERLIGSGWTVEKTPTAAKASAMLVVFDRSALEPMPSLMLQLGAKCDGYSGHWTRSVAKNFPETFVAWLQQLPDHCDVVLSSELATLRDASVKASVKLECSEAEIDWFDLRVVLNVEETNLQPHELQLLLKARGGYVRLPKKGWRRLEFNLSEEENERLARLGLSSQDFSGEPQRLHAMQLADEAAHRLLPAEQVEQLQRRASELKTRVAPPVPDSIRASLRPYQIEGFHFLAYLAANRFGGILADDMGLGKTLQTLTWIACLRAQATAPLKPILVVCPKSVTDNWLSESARFLPELRVKIWKSDAGTKVVDSVKDVDLLVMNYVQLRTISDQVEAVAWHVVILDEGQYIKNPQSQTAIVARALKAEYRLILSGTPIENRLLDLWSLMSFVMPGVLGPRAQFTRMFDRSDDPFARRRLAARVRPFLLRRTKDEVARELPDRTEEDLLCEMEGEQLVLYRAEMKRAQQALLRVQSQSELNEQRFHFLASLIRLRQICCHPALILKDGTAAESAKLNALIELLEPLMEQGHKVLVFSQFVTMLDLIRTAVQEREWPHFYLAGSTEDRGDLVQDFQKTNGSAVFLISLKAGGFGLNLTAASYVVLFDPWWNPAVESQAIDRTHRIGQTNKVIAYRILVKNTIEEKIRALQKTKAALVQDVLGEENFARALSLEDFQFLFSETS